MLPSRGTVTVDRANVLFCECDEIRADLIDWTLSDRYSKRSPVYNRVYSHDQQNEDEERSSLAFLQSKIEYLFLFSAEKRSPSDNHTAKSPPFNIPLPHSRVRCADYATRATMKH